MTTSKTPIKPIPVPEEVHNPFQPPIGENGAAGKLQPELAKSPFPFHYLGWMFFIALVGVGWYFAQTWLPLIGLGQKVAVKPPARIIPVVTATVEKKDMEVFINGLGTVTAFKTVTIRSRVEGELVKVLFTEGQMVHEGDLLAEIDKRPFEVQLQQAEGMLARDEATLKSSDLALQRYKELMASKSIAQKQVDDQRSIVQQTTGAIQSDRATVANAKLQLVYCHIIAPISGRIGLRLVDQGNIVRANDPLGLAVITQLQPIALVFTIPQDDISRVMTVDSTTGTVRIKAIFDNEDGLLFPNQFVNARLLVDTKKDAIVVPTAAVQRGPSSTFVYVVQADETVDLRNVTAGLVEGSETSIDAGLQPGEIVVTEGLDKLQKGATISTAGKEGKEKEPASGKESQEKGPKEKETKSDSSETIPKNNADAASPSGKKGSS